MTEMVKVEWQSQVPNLVALVVDTHRPQMAGQRSLPLKLKGVGKDRKKLKALAKGGGLISSGVGGFDLSLFESS